jgi:hypothetical protein
MLGWACVKTDHGIADRRQQRLGEERFEYSPDS